MLTIADAFPPPPGDVAVEGDAFSDWVAAHTVEPADRELRGYDGSPVDGHRARVIDLDMVSGDLQQCADSLIRLRAEWLRSTGESPSFHATSGDPMPWSRFQAGERPRAVSNRLVWSPGHGPAAWDAYLSAVFQWAGTRSLAYDTVGADEPRPGDLLVSPGSPGHAVALLAVARGDDGLEVLVGEGYLPATEFHVELGPDAGYWPWNDGVDLSTWGHLPATGLRRWK